MKEPAATEFHEDLQPSIPLMEVTRAWRVRVVISPDRLYVLHEQKEQCVVNRFELRWQLTTSIFLNDPTLLDDIHFKVCQRAPFPLPLPLSLRVSLVLI